ncbi:MAG: gliding motility-associated ABC transporter ATP-binding subunit GldA [Nonlabens sp.]
MSIKVDQISKRYGSQLALDRVSFEIKSGEIVGFLGPNGAGKSTMMRILTTYLNPSEGTATVNGFDTVSQGRNVQHSIGYLPENNPLYPDMYVREYLQFCARIYNLKNRREAMERTIIATGLESHQHKKTKDLSKGYKQRLGLASAILHQPKVLILDEPTTGLDPNQLVEIRKLIRDLAANSTILLSTHIMQEVEATCDRVIIINKGAIVADSYLADFKKNRDQVIHVEFDYKVEPELLHRIHKVREVTEIKGTGFHYELVFHSQEDMRSAVFDFAHDNELKILALNKRNKDLEHLFRELTGD